jgi:hypothetical protein
MDFFQTSLLVIGLPIFALTLHEITHLMIARATGPISVEFDSYIPFRLQLHFRNTPSLFTIPLVALSPLFIGGLLAIIAVQTGAWQQIQHSNPYCLHFLIGLNWILYTFPSPTDLRSALTIVENQQTRG